MQLGRVTAAEPIGRGPGDVLATALAARSRNRLCNANHPERLETVAAD